MGVRERDCSIEGRGVVAAEDEVEADAIWPLLDEAPRPGTETTLGASGEIDSADMAAATKKDS